MLVTPTLNWARLYNLLIKYKQMELSYQELTRIYLNKRVRD